VPLVAAALVPSAPLLLPEVTGPDAGDLAGLRESVAAAVAGLLTGGGGHRPQRVVVAARAEEGALAGMGAPVPGPDGPDGVVAPGWAHELGRILLTRAGFTGEVEDLVIAGPGPRDDETTGGEADTTAERLHQADERTALLVLADGAATRGPRAPAGEDPRGDEVDAGIAAALVTGEAPAVDPVLAQALQVRGLPGFAVATAATRGAGLSWDVLYTGAPAGVGYVVALAGAGAGAVRTADGPRP
jgi:hypothetical protein